MGSLSPTRPSARQQLYGESKNGLPGPHSGALGITRQATVLGFLLDAKRMVSALEKAEQAEASSQPILSK